jgi:small subunit ribosomal protein S15
MALTTEQKQQVLRGYQRGASDTGSPEVQLSARIEDLSEHFKSHSHDNHSRQGLLRMVNRRRKLLDYLKTHHSERYRELISRLGLRK